VSPCTSGRPASDHRGKLSCENHQVFIGDLGLQERNVLEDIFGFEFELFDCEIAFFELAERYGFSRGIDFPF